MTGRHVMWAARGVAIVLFAIGFALVLTSSPGMAGPVAGFDRCTLFYAMTVSTFLAAPKRRRVDLSLALILVLICGEAVAYCAAGQGHGFDIRLPFWDFGGIVAATIPAATERLRYAARRRGWAHLSVSNQL